jgi:hypothetical protein
MIGLNGLNELGAVTTNEKDVRMQKCIDERNEHFGCFNLWDVSFACLVMVVVAISCQMDKLARWD